MTFLIGLGLLLLGAFCGMVIVILAQFLGDMADDVVNEKDSVPCPTCGMPIMNPPRDVNP